MYPCPSQRNPVTGYRFGSQGSPAAGGESGNLGTPIRGLGLQPGTPNVFSPVTPMEAANVPVPSTPDDVGSEVPFSQSQLYYSNEWSAHGGGEVIPPSSQFTTSSQLPVHPRPTMLGEVLGGANYHNDFDPVPVRPMQSADVQDWGYEPGVYARRSGAVPTSSMPTSWDRSGEIPRSSMISSWDRPMEAPRSTNSTNWDQPVDGAHTSWGQSWIGPIASLFTGGANQSVEETPRWRGLSPGVHLLPRRDVPSKAARGILEERFYQQVAQNQIPPVRHREQNPIPAKGYTTTENDNWWQFGRWNKSAGNDEGVTRGSAQPPQHYEVSTPVPVPRPQGLSDVQSMRDYWSYGASPEPYPVTPFSRLPNPTGATGQGQISAPESQDLLGLDAKSGNKGMQEMLQQVLALVKSQEERVSRVESQTGANKEGDRHSKLPTPPGLTTPPNRPKFSYTDNEEGEYEEETKPPRKSRNRHLDDSVASSNGGKEFGKTILKVEFPKAKLTSITGGASENIEELLAAFERRIKIPNGGRDPPPLDKLELLRAICQKDADREQDVFMKSSEVLQLEAEGEYELIYEQLKKHLISNFQRPLLERQQQARSGMNHWSMGTKDFTVFQAGWRERLQTLREVKLEPAANRATSEQQSALLNDYLGKLRKDVRVHILLKVDNPADLTLQKAEELARKYCSAQDNEAAIQTGGTHAGDKVKVQQEDDTPDSEQVNAIQWTDAVQKAGGGMLNGNTTTKNTSAAPGPGVCEKCHECGGFGHRSPNCPNIVSKKQGVYGGIMQKIKDTGGQGSTCRTCAGSGHTSEHHSQKPPAGTGNAQGATKPGFNKDKGKDGNKIKSTSNAGKICRFISDGQPCPFGGKCKFSHTVKMQEEQEEEQGEEAIEVMQELAHDESCERVCTIAPMPVGTGKYKSLSDVPGWVEVKNPGPGKSKLMTFKIGNIACRCLPDSGSTTCTITERLALEIINRAESHPKEDNPIVHMHRYDRPSVVRGFLSKETALLGHELVLKGTFISSCGKEFTRQIKFKVVPGAVCDEVILSATALIKLGHQLTETGHAFHGFGIVCPYIETTSHACNQIVADHVRLVSSVALKAVDELILGAGQSGYLRTKPSSEVPDTVLWLRSQTEHEGLCCYEGPIDLTNEIIVTIVCNKSESTVIIEPNDTVACVSSMNEAQINFCHEMEPVSQRVSDVVRAIRGAGLPPKLDEAVNATGCFKVPDELPHEIGQGGAIKYPNTSSEEYRRAVIAETRQTGKLAHLSPPAQLLLEEVMYAQAPALWIEGAPPTRIKGVQFDIELAPDARPVRVQPMKASPEEMSKLERKIQKELQRGTLKPLTKGQWSSRAFTVYHPSDPDGRMVIDYRPVNKMTFKMSFPAPNPTEILQRVAGSLWQSLLDALWGFNQVELSDRAKEILAIVTWSGLYGWEVLPMGVTNGPPAYQQIMQHIFLECLWHCLAVFIDDCDVYSSCVVRAALRTLLRVEPAVIEKLKDTLLHAMAVEPENVLDSFMRATNHDHKVKQVAAGIPVAVPIGSILVEYGTFLHLFSGPPRLEDSLAAFLIEIGGIPTLEVDIITGFDILNNGKFETLLNAAEKGYFVGGHGGFPCETYCGLRNEHDGGPKPLRTRECPSGKPQVELSDRDWQQLQRANEISRRGLVVLGLISRGRGAGATVSPTTNSKTTLTKSSVKINPCSAENPADLGNGPSFWHHRWKELREHGLVVFAEVDHCMFEGVLHDFRHPLWVAGNFEEIALLEAGHVCTHPPKFHGQCRGKDPDTGKFKTAGTAAYPRGLNRMLARVIVGRVRASASEVVCRIESEAKNEHAGKGKLSIFELIEKERLASGEWEIPPNMSDEEDSEATAMHVGLLTALDKLVCPEDQARDIVKQILDSVSAATKQSIEWKEWLRFEELMLKHSSCSVHLVWHAVCLDRVLGLAVKAGLGFKLAKAKIAEWEIILLGNKTGRAGTSPDESKVATLRSFPVPPDPGAVRRFMGLANFIRPFAGPDFAKKAAPLTSTLQTGGESKFPLKGPELQSFLDVRECVAQDALLACADYRAARNWEKTGRPFEVFLDASDYHVGATLAQLDATKLKYRPLGYHSESLSGAQLNWIVWEKEMFAMRRSKEKFQGITSGYMTIYHTDHLNSVRLDALPPGVNSAKLIRWYQYINDGTSRIQALAGKANPAADCLSRPPKAADAVKVLRTNEGGLRDGMEYVDDGKNVRQIVRVMVLPGYDVQTFDEKGIAETLKVSGAYLPAGFEVRVFIADPPFLDNLNVPRWLGSESRTEHVRSKELKSQGKAGVMALRRQVVQFKPRVILAYGQSAIVLRLALDPDVVRWAEKETATDVDSANRQAQLWACVEVFGFVEGGMLPPGKALNEIISVFPCLKNVIGVPGINIHEIGLSSSYRHDGRLLAASLCEAQIVESQRRNGWPEKIDIALQARPSIAEAGEVVRVSSEFSWQEEQLKDSKCAELLEALKGPKTGRKFQVVDRSYELVNGVLHKAVPDYGLVVVVPSALKKQILYDCHNNLNGCHQPPEGLVRVLKERFYWDGMAKDAARWVACCKSCTARRRKAQKPSASIVRHKPPFYRVQIDLVGPLIPSSHEFKYIFVLICPSCRWPVLKPLRSKNKTEVAFALLNCLLEIGTFPPVIQCDRGREFLNQVMTVFVALLGSSMTANPSYTPRLLGVNEGSHKVMMASLSIALVEYVHAQLDRWSEFLPAVQHVLRGQPIGNTGKSPYDICQTWRHFAPVDVKLALVEPWTTVPQEAVSDDDVRMWLAALKRVSMQVHDAYVADVSRYQDQLAKSQWKPGGVAQFGVGDLVFLTRPPRLTEEGVNVSPKLLERAEGPFLIIDMQGNKRAFLGDKQGNLVDAFEQPVATSRLISYPGEWRSEWDRGESEESDDDMGIVSDDGFDDHPSFASLTVGVMIALYSNCIRLGMVSQLHPDEACVTLRLFCRLDETKQTCWVPAFFESNCEENYKRIQAVDNGKPAFLCLSIKRIFKKVELDRGMLRDYKAAEVPRH